MLDFATETITATQQCLLGNQLHSVDLARGKAISSVLICRMGNQLDAARSYESYRAHYPFASVDYCPSNVFIGSHWEAAKNKALQPQTLCLRSHSAVSQYFEALKRGFDEQTSSGSNELRSAYEKCGLPSWSLGECSQHIDSLLRDYEEICAATWEGESEAEGCNNEALAVDNNLCNEASDDQEKTQAQKEAEKAAEFYFPD